MSSTSFSMSDTTQKIPNLNCIICFTHIKWKCNKDELKSPPVHTITFTVFQQPINKRRQWQRRKERGGKKQKQTRTMRSTLKERGWLLRFCLLCLHTLSWWQWTRRFKLEVNTEGLNKVTSCLQHAHYAEVAGPRQEHVFLCSSSWGWSWECIIHLLQQTHSHLDKAVSTVRMMFFDFPSVCWRNNWRKHWCCLKKGQSRL